MPQLPEHADFSAFAARVNRAKDADARRAAIAGLNLVEGAKRIRRGGDGIYGDAPERPTTKQAEAVGAWLRELQRDIDSGEPFHRSAEVREAVVAAGEEVDTAVAAMPAAERLRGALYQDALATIGSSEPMTLRSTLPWIIASVLGGILIGLFMTKKRW